MLKPQEDENTKLLSSDDFDKESDNLHDKVQNILENITQKLPAQIEGFLTFDSNNDTLAKQLNESKQKLEDWEALLFQILDSINELKKNENKKYGEQEEVENNTNKLFPELIRIINKKFNMLNGYFNYHLNREKIPLDTTELKKLKNRLEYFLEASTVDQKLKNITDQEVNAAKQIVYNWLLVGGAFLCAADSIRHLMQEFYKIVCEKNIALLDKIIPKIDQTKNPNTSSKPAPNIPKIDQTKNPNTSSGQTNEIPIIPRRIINRDSLKNKKGLLNSPTYGTF